MKVLRLQTQGFKRVVAVDITPGDPVVEVRGNNAEGKSSLLDSIMAALGGASVAPIKPVRTGDDFAAIRIELGDDAPAIIVEKYFDEVGEKLRVMNADGAEYRKGQTTVSDLLGRMTFDPLAFAALAGDAQATELRRLVPLAVDLDALSEADKADTLARRDVNREGKALAARVEAINVSGIIPETRPDREAIVAELAGASDVNMAIDRERARRDAIVAGAGPVAEAIARRRENAARLREEARLMDENADRLAFERAEAEEALAALPPLGDPVDTVAVRERLTKAEADIALLDRKAARDSLSAQLDDLRAKSKSYSTAIETRAAERAKALAEAVMPVPGLALARRCDVIPGDASEDLIVMFEGEPFAQASGAQQLRVSMRLAMTANARLRVMLIRQGSLLDDRGLALVRELAAEGGYQVWLESVGEGDGSGIIMEAGAVRGAPEPERLGGPKRRKAKAEDDGGKPIASPASDAEIRAADGESLGAASDPEHGAIVSTSHDEARRQPESAPPPRRKPSDMRAKPAADLFGGDA